MGRWVPVREAAAALAVSEDTLKRRIKAGTIEGRQEKTDKGFRWLVEVPDDLSEPESGDNQDTAELIQSLKHQVTWLEGELEFRRREVAELHVLLQQQSQKAIPAPVEPYLPQTKGNTVEEPPYMSPQAPIHGPEISRPSIARGTEISVPSKQSFWKRLFTGST